MKLNDLTLRQVSDSKIDEYAHKKGISKSLARQLYINALGYDVVVNEIEAQMDFLMKQHFRKEQAEKENKPTQKTKNVSRAEFDIFRFGDLNFTSASNKYWTMDRVSEDENKIVVRVGDSHLVKTKFGYALILDNTHVVFIKDWQVSSNYFGNEVLLTREYCEVKEWGNHEEFDEDKENLLFDTWLAVAREQDALVDDDGTKINSVKWEK